MPLVKALVLAHMTTVAPVAPPPVAPVVTTSATDIDEVDPDAATLCGLFATRSGLHCSAVPAFENGRPIGFKMLGVHRRPAAQARGLHNGDIVVQINGFGMTSVEQGMQAVDSIKSCADMRLVVKRRGVVVELGPPVHAE